MKKALHSPVNPHRPYKALGPLSPLCCSGVTPVQRETGRQRVHEARLAHPTVLLLLASHRGSHPYMAHSMPSCQDFDKPLLGLFRHLSRFGLDFLLP